MSKTRLKLKPSKVSLTFAITRDDLKVGCEADTENCPAARALSRAVVDTFRQLNGVSVDLKFTRFWVAGPDSSEVEYKARSSPALRKFVDTFDESRTRAKPLTVKLKFKKQTCQK